MLEHHRSVDDHEQDTFSVLMRLLKGSGVAHGVGIEDDEIRFESFLEQPAIGQAEPLCRRP